ncbi:TPA: hypothetical protein ACX6QV_001727 [Photobacterium damselae]
MFVKPSSAIPLSLLFLSFSYNAFSLGITTEEWGDDGNGNLMVESKGSEYFYATIDYDTALQDVAVSFINFSPLSCSNGYSSKITRENPMIINRVKVKVSRQCVDNGVLRYFPTTDKGKNYLINQFKKNTNVSVSWYDKKYTFSTNGFHWSYKNKMIDPNGL